MPLLCANGEDWSDSGWPVVQKGSSSASSPAFVSSYLGVSNASSSTDACSCASGSKLHCTELEQSKSDAEWCEAERLKLVIDDVDVAPLRA